MKSRYLPPLSLLLLFLFPFDGIDLLTQMVSSYASLDPSIENLTKWRELQSARERSSIWCKVPLAGSGVPSIARRCGNREVPGDERRQASSCCNSRAWIREPDTLLSSLGGCWGSFDSKDAVASAGRLGWRVKQEVLVRATSPDPSESYWELIIGSGVRGSRAGKVCHCWKVARLFVVVSLNIYHKLLLLVVECRKLW